MDAKERALVEQTKKLIQKVDDLEAALRPKWIEIQRRVQQLYDGKTQREVAELLGKSARWVNTVLKWDVSGPGTSPATCTSSYSGPKAR
jgi:hypothetical protein